MYAIIATGGKQYKVAEGDVIRVEKLNAEDGASVTFDNVIVLNNKFVIVHVPVIHIKSTLNCSLNIIIQVAIW